MKRYIRYFFIGALLSSALLSAAPIRFDVKDKGIGFCQSPASIRTECLLSETFPGFSTTLFYNSAVEPTIAVNPRCGKQIVAAWQQDRFSNGGSLEIGVAYSNNGGERWHRTIVPFQSCNGGFVSGRLTDPWLSYSADGSRVYLAVTQVNAATDPNTNNQSGILVTFSEDNGKTWSNPHYLVADASTLETFPTFDKEAVTADPLIKDFAYVVWDQFLNAASFHADTWFSRTTNGGLSWEKSRLIYNPFLDPGLVSNGIENNNQTINNILVGLPNGDLLTFMTRLYAKPGATDLEYQNDVWPYQFTNFDIAVIRSTDHGVTWTQTATQVAVVDQNETYTCGYTLAGGNVTGGQGQQVRTLGQGGLFDVAVNPTDGTIYVVWQDSRFTTPGSHLPQIALSLSRDNGITWTAPVMVNRTPASAPNPQAFTPSVAVNAKGQVGILYHDFRNSAVPCTTQTKTDAWFALYQDTGTTLDFKAEARLSSQSYSMENGPLARGFMTNGDYNFLVARADDFYAIYMKSFNGPFSPAQTVIDDPALGTLILDNNRRSAPFFSKLDV